MCAEAWLPQVLEQDIRLGCLVWWRTVKGFPKLAGSHAADHMDQAGAWSLQAGFRQKLAPIIRDHHGILNPDAVLAGQVGVRDHVTVADNTVLAAKSAVMSEIGEAGMYSGIPAIPINKWLRSSAAFAKMPDLIKTVRRLEKRLDELENPDNKE